MLLKVRSGSSLSDALADEPRFFPPLYVSLVRAGEQSGRLGQSLGELATMRERTEQLRSKLTSAMIYPVVLFLTAIGAVVVLLTVVVPKMEPMFASAGAQPCPASTRVVLAATDFLREQGFLMLAVIAARLLLGERMLRRPGPRQAMDGGCCGCRSSVRCCATGSRPSSAAVSPPAWAAASICRRHWPSAATSWATCMPGRRWRK